MNVDTMESEFLAFLAMLQQLLQQMKSNVTAVQHEQMRSKDKELEESTRSLTDAFQKSIKTIYHSIQLWKQLKHPSLLEYETITVVMKRIIEHHLKMYGVQITSDIQEFQTLLNTFENKLKEKSIARLVSYDIDHEDAAEIYNHGLIDDAIQAKVNGRLRDVLCHIEGRHNIIQTLLRDVMEIKNLFDQLEMIVQMQGEAIDHLSINIESAKTQTSEGEVELRSASVWQCKARKRTCMVVGAILVCVIIAIIIVVVIANK